MCQKFTGAREADPHFPLKYQRDPWCWSAELGFHRASAPDIPVQLRAGIGARFAGPDFLIPHQALSLGYGLGTSNMGTRGIDEFVKRFVEIGEVVTFPDAATFAWFGHAARGYEQLPGECFHEPRRIVQQAVFREAYQLMGPPSASLLGPWAEPLRLAANGEAISPELAAWAEATASAGYAGRHAHPDRRRDYAAGHTFHALHAATHGGASRSLVELFALTRPDPEQATRWLLGVGDAIARHVAATNTAER